MEHRQVDAGAPLRWLGRGWTLFVANPGLWVVLALLLGVIMLVLQFVPLLGGLVAALISPALFGGMVYGARELAQDRPLEVPHLFQAFRASGLAGPMLMLGLVPLASAVIMQVLAFALMGAVAGTGAATGSGGAAVGMMAGGGLVLMLISALLGLVVGALLLFAIPRVMGGIDAPGLALQRSARAVLDNLSAYLVLAVLWFVLALVAAIPFGLGFLVLMPVMAGAVHAAHTEVFGVEA